MNRKKVNRSFSRSIMLLFALLLFPSIMMAQQISVTGTIVDNETKEPLIGVSIGEKGTTNGTMTDVDGKFTLKVKVGAPLMINYVGYAPVELPAKEVMNIELKSTATALDEVQIVGYGVQKKSVVTAAISSVKGEALAKSTPTRVDNVLRGQVSGVSITQQSGQPGDGSKVLIRGAGTINDSSPLYIVDGMPFKDGMDYLNPSDIESVEVLKDGASTAIYGTRGANGVILVTTKKGKSGKATINYNFSYGWQRPWRHKKVLNGEQYIELINEVNSGNAFVGGVTNYNTNWQDELFYNDAPVVNHQLSLSGGTDKGNYYLSFAYFSQDGIAGGNYKRSNYDRYTVRSNNNYTLFDDKGSRKILNKLQAGVNISYSRMKSTGLTTNSEYGGILGNALMAPPIFPVIAPQADQDAYAAHEQMKNGVKNKNDQYYYIFGTNTNEIVNPLATLSTPGTWKNEDKFTASMWAELDILNNLKFKTSAGTDFDFWGNDYSAGIYYLSTTNQTTKSTVNSSMNRGMTWQLENTLVYSMAINKEHNLTVLVGQSAKKEKNRALYGLAQDLLDVSLPNIDASLTQDTDRKATGRRYADYNMASYFGRLSYDFDERYMAEFTIRRDGSSKFGPNHQWAVFPSISAGWNVKNEKFMEGKLNWLSSLKLRASWGKNGNDNIPDDFGYVSLLVPGQNYYLGKGETAGFKPGISSVSYANESIGWEESEQYDLGFDSRFLNGALSFTFDWFVKKTNKMLMRMTLPQYTGSKPPYANVGNMENKGIEMDVNYRFAVSDFKFRIGANASYIKNKLTSLGSTGDDYINYDGSGVGTISRGEVGLPFPYFYGRKTAGVFQNQAQIDAYVNKDGNKLQPNAAPGDAIFVDINGDGIIDDNDQTKIGKGMPDWTVGFNLGVEYKGFDLTANLQGTIGNDIYDATRRLQVTYLNLPSYTLGRWHGEGTSNKYPRLATANDNKNWQSSDLYVSNGSFLRLRTLQIGYTLPAVLTKKMYLQNLRVFASAENLFTITSYEGSDPEISSGGTSIGIDRGVYPQARTFTVGANITF